MPSCLPYPSRLLLLLYQYIHSILVFGTLHLKFYSCLRLRFRMLRLIRAHGVLFRLAAECSAAMYGVSSGTLVFWPWLRLSMIYCCALKPWSQICVMCQSCWFLGSVTLFSCAGASCFVPVGWRHMYEMDMEHFANQNLSVVVVKCWCQGLWFKTELLCV